MYNTSDHTWTPCRLTAEDPATRGQIGSRHTGLTQLDPPPPGAIPSTADQPEEGRLVRVGNMLQVSAQSQKLT